MEGSALRGRSAITTSVCPRYRLFAVLPTTYSFLIAFKIYSLGEKKDCDMVHVVSLFWLKAVEVLVWIKILFTLNSLSSPSRLISLCINYTWREIRHLYLEVIIWGKKDRYHGSSCSKVTSCRVTTKVLNVSSRSRFGSPTDSNTLKPDTFQPMRAFHLCVY